MPLLADGLRGALFHDRMSMFREITEYLANRIFVLKPLLSRQQGQAVLRRSHDFSLSGAERAAMQGYTNGSTLTTLT